MKSRSLGDREKHFLALLSAKYIITRSALKVRSILGSRNCIFFLQLHHLFLLLGFFFELHKKKYFSVFRATLDFLLYTFHTPPPARLL